MEQLQHKIENEIAILKCFIARYEWVNDSESICMVIAYRYALQAFIEVYELTKQKEVTPF
ncbi:MULTISPECIES: hypothetical protein [Bacillus]|uniref:hypothetical protein n=1 Tax=Bacillus TaxID=1386 RepID=UPI0004098805|nr:hypothetical protein [Bacillus thuringiensis]EKS8367019.1 hypothetical protein [Bacillus cereus]EKS8373908.1 hypothetical protein [Bacillus cereus]MBG9483450.1 hypothetical protein [Bacillus thuringiensis]MBG9484836.1 hypothetical protein [Bacillus thuringiensis]MBG9485963.1 hypothetical protein [Bacillus thuringiensis]